MAIEELLQFEINVSVFWDTFQKFEVSNVQNTLKQYSNIHPSYLQDTPDDEILVTVDVTGLYTNIDQ